MSDQSFTIPGRMLGRNEREDLARTHWAKASKAKKRETEEVERCIRAAGIEPAAGPVEVSIVFSERVEFYKNGTRKKPRDVDNVADAQKPILDALVNCGIVPDDGPDYVKRVLPVVKYTKGEPHITVAVLDYEPWRRVTYPPVNVPRTADEGDEYE